jgi:hypothetical protein
MAWQTFDNVRFPSLSSCRPAKRMIEELPMLVVTAGA